MSIFFDTAGQALNGQQSSGTIVDVSKCRLMTGWLRIPASASQGSVNVAYGAWSSTFGAGLYMASSSAQAVVGRAANGAGTVTPLSHPAVMADDEWVLTGVFVTPDAEPASFTVYGGDAQKTTALATPSDGASRVHDDLWIGRHHTDSSSRWRGYIAEVALWTPNDKAHADAIIAELKTKTPDTVSVASPVWYRALRSDLTEGDAGDTSNWDLTVFGSPTFDAAIHPTLTGASESVTLSPATASVTTGGTRQFTLTRSVVAPTGGITYNLTSSATGVATVPASVTLAQGATSTTFNATAVGTGSATISATNAADSSETDSSALTVTASTVKKLRLLAHIDALGATAVKGAVHNAPAGGALTGTKIGEFSSQAFSATATSGQAELKVDAATWGGSGLAAGTNIVVVWEGTAAAGSALGSGAAIGSVGPHECTVIEE